MTKEKKRWTKKHISISIAVAGLLLVVAVLLILWLNQDENAPAVITGNPQTTVEHPIEINPQMQNMGQAQSAESVKTLQIAGFTDRSFISSTELENGLSIVRSGSYTGSFVEDGSNSPCTGVLSLLVTNASDSFLEWAEIAVPVGEKTAYFRITSLPAGQSLLVMEKAAMTYDESTTYGAPVLLNSSIPEKEFSLHEQTFSISAADHVINLTNVSSHDITGNIAVYYKNVENGIYIGGITYSRTLQNGVAAKAVAQFICEYYTVAGSEILFIVYES